MEARVIMREIRSQLDSIMVLAATLSIQNTRERPLDAQAAADDWKETGLGQ